MDVIDALMLLDDVDSVDHNIDMIQTEDDD